MQRSQIFVQNRVFCLPHLHSTPPSWGFPSDYLTDTHTDTQTPHADIIGRAYALHRAAKTTTCAGAQVKLVWIQGQLQVDRTKGDVSTCKFVGDASLNNDSIHSLCDLLNFANISNGANLQLPLDTQKQKGIQLQGASPPDPPTGGSAPDPRYRLALHARHGIRILCSSKLINWFLKIPVMSLLDFINSVSQTDDIQDVSS